VSASVLLPDTAGDVLLVGDDLGRQLERAAAAELLLDA
jgi:hypothetical protein